MKICLLLGVVTLFQASLPGIGRARLEAVQSQERLGKPAPPYWDMVQAYEGGRLADARRLARVYLMRAGDSLARAANDREKTSAVRMILGIVRAMLEAEDRLPRPERLGGDVTLSRSVRDTLTQARSAAGTLTPTDPLLQRYFKGELGTAAQLWLRAAASVLPRAELVAFFQVFQSDLAAQRITALDGALAEPGLRAPATLTAAPADNERLLAIVRDYFIGFARGDQALVTSATGLGATRLSALMAERDEGYRRERIRAVANVTVPSQPLTLRAVPGRDSEYEFSVRGIIREAVRVDGTRSVETGDRHFRARKDASGHWTIVIPG